MLNQEKIEMAALSLWPAEVDAIIILLEQEDPLDVEFLARVKEFREDMYANSEHLQKYFPAPGKNCRGDAEFLEIVREKFS